MEPILQFAKRQADMQSRLGRAATLRRQLPLAEQLASAPAAAVSNPPPAPPLQAATAPETSPPTDSPQQLPGTQPGVPENPFSKPTWEEVRGQLNQMRDQWDDSAATYLAQLNKQTDLARESLESGKLRPAEFGQIISGIEKKAENYKWEHHVKRPGSSIGDVITQDGIEKIREADGIRPIGYTAEYIAKNVSPIGDSGNLLVPVAPGQPAKIIDKRQWERNAKNEMTETKAMFGEIQKRFTELEKARKISKAITNRAGEVIGYEPFSPNELRAMSVEAADLVAKQFMQARHVYKTIIDGRPGKIPRSQEAVTGDTFDPFKKEQDIEITKIQHDTIKQMAEAEVQAAEEVEQGLQVYREHLAEGRRELAAMQPTPSMTPVPAKQTKPRWGLFNEDNLATTTATSSRLGTTTPEQSAVNTYRREKKLASLRANTTSGKTFQSRLAAAAIAKRPMLVGSKEEMNERFKTKDTPDGFVVELPDGRRYVKDEGKFWQVPWTAADMASPVMISHSPETEGQVIIDPSTDRPAVGISQQLDAGESAMIPMDMQDQPQPPPRQAEGPPGPVIVPPGPAGPQPPQPPQPAAELVTEDEDEADPEKNPPLGFLITNPKLLQSVINPAKTLKVGERPTDLKPGQAFVMPNGRVFIYRGKGRYVGPFTPTAIRNAERLLLRGTIPDEPAAHRGLM